MEYGVEKTADKSTLESDNTVPGYTTYATSVDIGLATGDLWTIVKIALLYSRMLFLSVFLREMAQYTFSRIDEKTCTFYEQSLNELVRSFKFQSELKETTFFHEIINHLSGKPVSAVLREVLKRGKGAQHCIQVLDDFCYNKMK